MSDLPPYYEMENGTVVTETYIDGAVRRAVMVRAGLEDAVVLEACVAELRRRGYTVTEPAKGEK